MKKIKVRFEKVVADLYYDESLSNNRLIIFCPGIPGKWEYESFAREFVSQGFIFLHLKYIGSWESDGSFSISNCKRSVQQVISSVRKEMRDIFGNPVEVCFQKIFLMGHSFGGSLALVVGAGGLVDGIISLAPIIDFREQNSDKSLAEEDLSGLLDYLKKGFKNLFRNLERNDWLNFCETGSNLNPIDFFDNFAGKCIFLAHGQLDESVNYLKTRRFYRRLKSIVKNITYFEPKKADHSSIREKSCGKIISWILSLG